MRGAGLFRDNVARAPWVIAIVLFSAQMLLTATSRELYGPQPFWSMAKIAWQTALCVGFWQLRGHSPALVVAAVIMAVTGFFELSLPILEAFRIGVGELYGLRLVEWGLQAGVILTAAVASIRASWRIRTALCIVGLGVFVGLLADLESGLVEFSAPPYLIAMVVFAVGNVILLCDSHTKSAKPSASNRLVARRNQ
jgi:hypothetical protein